MQQKIMRLPAVAEGLTVAQSTIRRWVSDGKFPRPIRLGQNTVAWRISDIEEWLADRPPVGADNLSVQ